MAVVANLNRGESLGDRILKVNHAGEHGAVNIYRGQAAMSQLRAPSLLPELHEFQSHEERHRALFWAELQRRGKSRCRSYHLCGVGGYMLGFVTGILGAAAVAATTVAVERVVLQHLTHQMEALRETDASAFAAVSAIVREEREHHDRAAGVAVSAFWLKILMPVVSTSTEFVIWLGMRL
jgi:ubiquinone biosynthesis monooxygenase Coq7